MFLHIGGDVIILKKDVIAIIDLKQPYKSKINAEFLRLADNEGSMAVVCEPDKVKSFIVTTNKVYFSPVSSVTLKKRSAIDGGEEELEDDE